MVIKKVVPAIATAVVVGGVVWALMSSFLIGVIVGLICGVGVAAVLLARSRGEKPSDVIRETVREATKPDDGSAVLVQVHEQLLRTNQKIRLLGQELTLIEPFEDVVDRLRLLVPRAIEFAPAAEATFNIKKLATDDLPKLVSQFMNLSPADRLAKDQDFAQQMNEVQERLSKLGSFIDAGQLSEYTAEELFVKLKFA